MKPIRLAIVASHPIQHFCPLYRALAADDRIDLAVLFASTAGARPYFDPAFGKTIAWGEEMLAGFRHEVIGRESDSIAASISTARPGQRLSEFGPDVVQVYGYGDPLARRTLAWSAWHHVPAVMVSDSELLTPRRQGRGIVKRLLLPMVFRAPTGFFSVGDENERYLMRYGVSRRRIHRSPIPIDTPSLDSVLDRRDGVRTEERARWGAQPDDLVVLAVGKSIPRKRHGDLIEAVSKLPPEVRKRVLVVLAGGGQEGDDLANRASAHGVRLTQLGFLSLDRLFRAYVAADVLVHPSEADPHPLAVAEAVYCGLPVLVSDRVGSWGPTDDVRPGANGIRFPLGDVETLAQHISAVLGDSELRSTLGRASHSIGQSRRLEASAATYIEGLMKIVAPD